MTDRIITLMRHGKVDGPAALYGHTDIALSSLGAMELQQSIAQVHRRNPVSQVISSPLIRCAIAAQEFAQQQQLPVQIIDDLKEMHFGAWDGIAFEQLDAQQWQQLNQFWETPAQAQAPGGESLQEFAARIINCWTKIADNTSAQHQLVLCHGGVIRILIAQLLGLDWHNPSLFRQLSIDYASHTRIEIAAHPAALPVIKYIGASHF